jgi:hypothetical protein
MFNNKKKKQSEKATYSTIKSIRHLGKNKIIGTITRLVVPRDWR